MRISLGILICLCLVGQVTWRKPDGLTFAYNPKWSQYFAPESTVGHTHTNLKPLLQGNRIAILGFTHSRNPDDGQFKEAGLIWDKFKPTVVLVEGKPSGPLAAFKSIEKFGESGYLAGRARREGLRHYTWDVPEDKLVSALASQFPKEDVALFITGNAYFSRFRFGKPSDPNAELQNLINKRGTYNEINGVITTVADYDRLWKQKFPKEKDWRDTSDQYGLPQQLEQIAVVSRHIRDCHLLESIQALIRKGERVLAGVGQSHAIRIEPALVHLTK